MPIVAFCLTAFEILGVGCAALAVLTRFWGPVTNWAQLIFLVGALGLLSNYVFFLVGLNLHQTELIEIPIALIGIMFLIAGYLKRSKRLELLGAKKILWSLPLFAVIAIRLVATVSRCWDATMIWFFFSKWIYFRGGLWSALPDLTNKLLGFSHQDYPKITSVIGAQLAHSLGVWNYHFPQLALLFLFIPTWLGFLTIAEAGWTFIFFMILCWLKLGDLLWYGCVDAYVALFAALASLFFSRYYYSRCKWDLGSCLISLALCGCIKNEGMLMVLSIVTAMVVIATVYHFRDAGFFKKYWPGVFLFVPIFLWEFLRLKWHIPNDLGLGSAASFHQAWRRITDFSKIQLIFSSLFVSGELGRRVIVAIVFLFTWWKFDRTKRERIYFVVLSTTLYLLGLIWVYFSTPHNLKWHLDQSAGRTTLWPEIMYLVLIWWSAQSLYEDGSRKLAASAK